MTKSSKRDVFVPSDYWYSWWKRDELFEGNSIYPIDEEDSDLIPIFLKDEAIIPMTTNNFDYIPNESQDELTLLLVTKDNSNPLTFNFIEYFDSENALGLQITLTKEQSIIHLSLEEIRKGTIPSNYFLPKTIRFEINYFIRSIKELDKEKYEIQTDKDDWSIVIIKDVSFPMNLSIETVF